MDNFDIYQMIQEEVDVNGDVVSLSSLVLRDLEGRLDAQGVGEQKVTSGIDALENERYSSQTAFNNDPVSDLFISEERVGLLSKEEEIIEEYTLPDDDMWCLENIWRFLICSFVVVMCFAFCYYYFRQKKNKRQAVDWEVVNHFGARDLQNSIPQLPHVSAWKDSQYALRVLRSVAAICRQKASELAALDGDETTVPSSVMDTLSVGHALFSSIFQEEEDESDEEMLQGLVPADVDEELHLTVFKLRASRSRLEMHAAYKISEKFRRTTRVIMQDLASAVALENVSDAYFGTELCRLMDGKYRHLNLQREAPFTAALQLLEARRTGDEKKALDDENGATERILVEYKRSFAVLSHHQTGSSSSIMPSHNRIADIHQRSSSLDLVCDRSSSDDVTHPSGNVVVSSSHVGAPDYSQQLSILHHMNAIRADSDRSLMQRLESLRTADTNMKESAGVRAMDYQRQFAMSVDIDEQLRRARPTARKEDAVLVSRRDNLIQERQRQKLRQNLIYKWFSYALLLCGAFIFCNGAVEGQGEVTATGGNTKSSIVDWAFFQMRMVCIYINEDNEQCSTKDDFLQYDFTQPDDEPLSTIFTQISIVGSAPRLWSSAKGLLWNGIELALWRSLHLDSNWLYHTVLPCLFDLVMRMIPVWILSYILNCFGFLSTGSVLVTFAALYRMRRPIKLFLLQFRLLGLVVLLPVCMHVLLELMDRRVSWRLYRIYTHGVDGVASIGSVRAKSVDIRFWVLYVIVPGLYLSTCYILGRYHS